MGTNPTTGRPIRRAPDPREDADRALLSSGPGGTLVLHYVEPVYRPPSEAHSFILQATIGCSFNRCSFCSMYRTKSFRVREIEEIAADIVLASRMDPGIRRVFLADGDALVGDTAWLVEILERLSSAFPELQRVSSYAWPLNLINKSRDELRALREKKLSLVYVGLESGSDRLLKRITKGANADIHGRAISNAREAGMKVSATMILGLGGRLHQEEHVSQTAALINDAPPNYLSTLQLGVADIVEDEFHRKFGEDFEWCDDADMLYELESFLELAQPPSRVIFRSNHASNALALAGTLPRDRDRLLREVRAARGGETSLRPWWIRGY